MESPPSTSTWSDPFILSDDSGLLLTGSSVSSGSMSGESHTFSRFATDVRYKFFILTFKRSRKFGSLQPIYIILTILIFFNHNSVDLNIICFFVLIKRFWCTTCACDLLN